MTVNVQQRLINIRKVIFPRQSQPCFPVLKSAQSFVKSSLLIETFRPQQHIDRDETPPEKFSIIPFIDWPSCVALPQNRSVLIDYIAVTVYECCIISAFLKFCKLLLQFLRQPFIIIIEVGYVLILSPPPPALYAILRAVFRA